LVLSFFPFKRSSRLEAYEQEKKNYGWINKDSAEKRSQASRNQIEQSREADTGIKHVDALPEMALRQTKKEMNFMTH
jgi:hypothetical protein